MNTVSISGRLGELKEKTLNDGTFIVDTILYKSCVKAKGSNELKEVGIPVSFYGNIALKVMSFYEQGDHVLVSGLLKGTALHDFFVLSVQGKAIYLLQDLDEGEQDV